MVTLKIFIITFFILFISLSVLAQGFDLNKFKIKIGGNSQTQTGHLIGTPGLSTEFTILFVSRG